MCHHPRDPAVAAGWSARRVTVEASWPSARAALSGPSPPQDAACIIACMVALQIREVPEELRDRLSELARQRGQSLQAYLFDVLRDEARRQDNLAVLDRFSKGTYGTRLSPTDIRDALAAERAKRETELGVPEAGR
jgi:antitoxin FitA